MYLQNKKVECVNSTNINCMSETSAVLCLVPGEGVKP